MALVGMGSVILDGTTISKKVIIGAKSLVPSGKTLESGYLYMGSPAKRVRKLSEQERVSIGDYARNYVRYSRVYRGEHSYTENPFYLRDL